MSQIEQPASGQTQFPADTPQGRFSRVMQTVGHRAEGVRGAIHEAITPNILLKAVPPVTVGAVGLLGAAEGYLRSKNIEFAGAYGIIHILPSIIWYRYPDEMVAEVGGISPDVIDKLSPVATIAADALYIIRSGIAGSVLLGYVIGGINKMQNAGGELKERILAGTQRVRPPEETIFFVGGKRSGPMEALAASSQNIIPVTEGAEAITPLLEEMVPKHRGEKPFYIAVPDKYDEIDLKGRVHLTESALLQTDDGRRVLVVVGDGTVYNEEFPFKRESQQDVTIRELQIATEALGEVAEAQDLHVDEVVRIYIGDGEYPSQTGSGRYTSTLREEVDEYGSVEVFIDSRAPLIQSIREWLGDRDAVVFHTKNQEYFATATELLGRYGIQVYDQKDSDIPSDTPVLVYEDTTADTVIRAREIKNLQQSLDVVALTSTVDGHELAAKYDIPDICSSLVYQEVILEVIKKIKEGKTADEVQELIDIALS